MSNFSAHPASFKDPSGFIFKQGDTYYRQVNQVYASNYDHLMSSGLYDQLVKQNKLIAHSEIDTLRGNPFNWYKTLLPQQLPYISYAYEWSFDQLKDAALLTLDIQQTALQKGMILKDATPFNIAFNNSKPIFIDTLSFERYIEGEPWVAYKQFCESFLAPLLLMKYRQLELNKLLILYPNGIPLTLAAALLPFITKFNLGIYLHIHLQARFQKKAGNAPSASKHHLGAKQLSNIINNLANLIKNIKLPNQHTTWNNYYESTILSQEYLTAKENLVKEFLEPLNYKSVLDLGANTGEFTWIAAKKAEWVIAADFDAACINQVYLQCKARKITNVFPLVINAANPTPAIGWAHEERAAFWQRTNTDVIMALAVIHHLCISSNISLTQMAELLKNKCHYLLIEFVPKSDPKLQQLLSYRKDVFEDYTQENFEQVFSRHFDILKKSSIPSVTRTLYLMQTKK
jgi:ribosomal protein L11 methylase PrmA